jgi:hypothetical protein
LGFSFYSSRVVVVTYRTRGRRGSLRYKGRGGGRLVLPVGGEHGRALVVARKAVDAALNENEAVLAVPVLAVLLHVLAHGNRLLDEVVQILGDLGRETCEREGGGERERERERRERERESREREEGEEGGRERREREREEEERRERGRERGERRKKGGRERERERE